MKTKFRLTNIARYFLYTLLCVVLFSCNLTPKKPATKPFIVTYKFPEGVRCNGDYCSYEYTDANGLVVAFCETEDAYRIGDTIK